MTAALQLLSHLEADALNVALLVPAPRRVLPGGLVDALTEHYSSPGRLADDRRQFERVSWVPGTDPSIFAVELEKLAMRAFGDLSQLARLRLVRDRLIYSRKSELYFIDIWIAWRRRLLYRISSTDAVCGRVMRSSWTIGETAPPRDSPFLSIRSTMGGRAIAQPG